MPSNASSPSASYLRLRSPWHSPDALVFSHPTVEPISISLEEPKGNLRLVSVWSDHRKALPESEAVSSG